VETNAVTIIGDGPDERVPLTSKAMVAGILLDRVAGLLAAASTDIS
jgi:hypothetical protein